MNTPNFSQQQVTILAFDTTSDRASVALWSSGKMTSRPLVSLNASRPCEDQASGLILLMQELLAQEQVTFQDLDVIATPTGPGSFTGIRLGMATAQGLMLGLASGEKTVCFAPTTFQVMAFDGFSGKQGNQKVLVTLDTKRNSFYTQLFDENLRVVGSPKIMDSSEIQEILDENPGVCRVETSQIVLSENLIGLYFYWRQYHPDVAIPDQLKPFYLHDPEFAKRKPWSP